MQTYSEYAPTQFDNKGAFLDKDRQNWLVLPVVRTRDSEALERSNFRTALEMVGGESDTVEVHRVGHWGPGWFEIIIVAPCSPASEIAEGIERALEDYPVLSDEDYSSEESDEAYECWNNFARRDLIDAIAREFALSDKAKDTLDDMDSDALYQRYCDSASEPYHSDSGGVTFTSGIRYYVHYMTRKDVAALLREARKDA